MAMRRQDNSLSCSCSITKRNEKKKREKDSQEVGQHGRQGRHLVIDERGHFLWSLQMLQAQSIEECSRRLQQQKHHSLIV